MTELGTDRHRYEAWGGKCKHCGRVYSNPVHRQSLDALHKPLPRAIDSITVDEMVEALLHSRLAYESTDTHDQRYNTRPWAEKLLARLKEGPAA